MSYISSGTSSHFNLMLMFRFLDTVHLRVWWVHEPTCNQSERKRTCLLNCLLQYQKEDTFILLCCWNFYMISVHCSLTWTQILNLFPVRKIKYIRSESAACKGEATFIFNIYLPLYIFVEILPDNGRNGWTI